MNTAGKSQKGGHMDEDMNQAELLVEKAEENQTRKILRLLDKSESLEDAKQKIESLLKQ